MPGWHFTKQYSLLFQLQKNYRILFPLFFLKSSLKKSNIEDRKSNFLQDSIIFDSPFLSDTRRSFSQLLLVSKPVFPLVTLHCNPAGELFSQAGQTHFFLLFHYL